MVHRALQAAEVLAKDGIEAEVIDLRWLAPLDTGTVVESVRGQRVLIVEEGAARGGWGGNVGLAVAEEALDALDAPIRRLVDRTHRCRSRRTSRPPSSGRDRTSPRLAGSSGRPFSATPTRRKFNVGSRGGSRGRGSSKSSGLEARPDPSRGDQRHKEEER